ncbi:LacI family DNA-binding transcriptional regulator [Ancylobacter defluvii]|uniref:LacI family transcriptional regulator n=1 Tax=Ancylobacter defluvii TaxID=1282440 RepID=A0A9W6JV64_9HYPH|nr:LacI family DNA-binding transcriptional regulator [Ancylobacter defluvii]MBS7590005.1 LacI family DNA-binding transcriptional regulator [Ancylobacter defluvii]GLK83133.1 LacI family transcriptional regulator [Ancylobacter defluvii]
MKEKKSFTIRDIAGAAGVSPATVSLVLNGKGEISGVTRARVLEAAARLNYVPRLARPRVEAAGTVRFLKIAKHGHTVNRDHSVFVSDYIDGMSAEATRRGYTLEVVSHEGQSIISVADTLAVAPVSGVIALGTEISETDIRVLQGVGRPIVFIDTFYDVVEANFVNMNNEDAVHQVLARLRQQGFERIGFVASHVDTTNFRLRREAFHRNMARLGLPIDPAHIISVESTYDGAHADTLKALGEGIALADGYFCTNDVIAYGFIKALRDFGIRIPEDVGVIGFDNLPLSSTMEPALTTIDVSKRKIGNLAVTVLDDLIHAAEPQPPVKILVGARLVTRASDRGPGEPGPAPQAVRRRGIAETA